MPLCVCGQDGEQFGYLGSGRPVKVGNVRAAQTFAYSASNVPDIR